MNRVLSREEINRAAKETCFIQRDKKIDAMAFLKMLFFDHLQNEHPSLQQHAFSIFDETDIKVSKQAIDKRFNDKAVDFIKKLF